MSIEQLQNQATGEFVGLIANKAGSGGRAVHPETAIANAARLAGSLLLRSFNLTFANVEPGTVVLSHEANEKGAQLVSVIQAFLSNAGVQLDESLLGGEEAQRGTPTELSVLQTLSPLQADALNIATRNGLSLEQAAHSAAVATAFIVKECARNIQAETGFNVAVFGIIEGSKTAPPIMMTQYTPIPKTKPWYKLW